MLLSEGYIIYSYNKDSYWLLYNQKHISIKQIANLVCGNDSRNKSKNSRDTEFKKTLERIKYAVKKQDNPAVTINNDVDSEVLFKITAHLYPDFRRKLPDGLISNDISMSVNDGSPIISGFISSTPQDQQELEKRYLRLEDENHALKAEAVLLKKRISQLDAKLKKQDKTRKYNASGGKKSKGASKNR